MSYFLNAFGASLMSVAFFSLGLWIRDMNKLPFTIVRAHLAWVAAAVHLAVCAAWIANGYAGGQTDFGRLVQTWQWIGRVFGGGVIIWSVILGYRANAREAALKRRLIERLEG